MKFLYFFVFLLEIYATKKKQAKKNYRHTSIIKETQKKEDSCVERLKKKLPDILIYNNLSENLENFYHNKDIADEFTEVLYRWFKEIFSNDYYTSKILKNLTEFLENHEKCFKTHDINTDFDKIFYTFLNQVVIIFHEYCKNIPDKFRDKISKKFYNEVIQNLTEEYNKSNVDLDSQVSETIIFEISESKQTFMSQKRLNMHQWIIYQLTEVDRSSEKFSVFFHLYKNFGTFLSEIFAYFSDIDECLLFLQTNDSKYLKYEVKNSVYIFERFKIKNKVYLYEGFFLDDVVDRFFRRIPYFITNEKNIEIADNIKDDKSIPPELLRLNQTQLLKIPSDLIVKKNKPGDENTKSLGSDNTEIDKLVKQIKDKAIKPTLRIEKTKYSQIYLYLDFNALFEASFLSKFMKLICDKYNLKGDDHLKFLIASRLYLQKNPEIHKEIDEQPEYFILLFNILKNLKEYRFCICIVYHNKSYIDFIPACENVNGFSTQKKEKIEKIDDRTNPNLGIYIGDNFESRINTEIDSKNQNSETPKAGSSAKISKFKKEVLDHLISKFNLKTYIFFSNLFLKSIDHSSISINSDERIRIHGFQPYNTTQAVDKSQVA